MELLGSLSYTLLAMLCFYEVFRYDNIVSPSRLVSDAKDRFDVLGNYAVVALAVGTAEVVVENIADFTEVVVGVYITLYLLWVWYNNTEVKV